MSAAPTYGFDCGHRCCSDRYLTQHAHLTNTNSVTGNRYLTAADCTTCKNGWEADVLESLSVPELLEQIEKLTAERDEARQALEDFRYQRNTTHGAKR